MLLKNLIQEGCWNSQVADFRKELLTTALKQLSEGNLSAE